MTFTEFYSKIESVFQAYQTSGLLNQMDIYDDYMWALNRFGALPLELFEEVIEIQNGSGKLPENFRKLILASKCEPYQYETKYEDFLQKSNFWRERTEKLAEWNKCDTCCITESEKFIVENVYYRDYSAKFVYKNPIELRLVQGVNRVYCDNSCVNLQVRQSPYEANIIKGKILQTNFTKGNVFLRYKGFHLGDDNFVEIPDTFNGNLEKYIENEVKTRIMERIIANGDNTQSEISLLSYYASEARNFFNLAMTELKANQFSSEARRRLKNKMRLEYKKIEYITP